MKQHTSSIRKIIAVITTAIVAATTALAGETTCRFDEGGNFRILQLTDLHLQIQKAEEMLRVFDRIDFLVACDRPDFIVITGDMVYSKPAAPALQALVDKLDAVKLPWAAVLGNHDAEQDLSRAEMARIITSGSMNMNSLDDNGELADIRIPVSGGHETAYYIYCLDSHDYSTLKDVPGYGWFTPGQVQRVREWSAARDGMGNIIPSLAFFHIPLPEYIDAWAPMENPRHGAGDKSRCVGIRGENIASARINSGMFAAMKEGGSVQGVFAGHDHDSDFTAVYCGIALSYGRFSGCSSTVYNNIPRGGRIIALKQGRKGFDTWTRNDEGRVANRVYFDGEKLIRSKGSQHSGFKRDRIIEVAGRQGIAADSDFYYVSSSTALYKYDKNGTLLQSNEDPFRGLELPANHFGDIDVYDGEIYTGIETFIDGVGKNIQVAVYDAKSLEYKYSIPWDSKSGQVEVCGLAVDREHGRVWMADWVQGHEIYCYDIGSRKYVGKVALDPAPKLQQGIFIKEGHVYISCDDGDAEQLIPDHIYMANLYPEGNDLVAASRNRYKPAARVQAILWRTMDEFTRAGEIEGLCFDNAAGQLIVLSNRGSRIILGMVRGFYPGYDREIHELYLFSQIK